MSEEVQNSIPKPYIAHNTNILILEDQIEIAEGIAAFLNCEKFSTNIVTSVNEALQSLKIRKPDVILSDFYMPGKTGMDFFKEVKRNPEWSDIPFIFISGKSDEDFIHQSIGLGCDYFIKKPVDPPELKALINGRLRQVRTRKELENLKLAQFKKKIIHTLSHEFRTPLVSITTGTEILLEEDDLETEQAKTLLKSIMRGGQRLERLVEDFMLVQQIEVGHTSNSFREFSSPIAVSEILDQLSNRVKTDLSEIYPGFFFKIDVNKKDINLKCEVFLPQILDAFLRLVDNAFKFSPTEKKCQLSITKDENQIHFSFRDWGSGLPELPDVEEQAVEQFIQIKREVHEQQGCGIGLNVASYLISLHSGEIKLVRPADGAGLEVIVSLPLI